MTVKEIFDLRKQGKIEEAYNAIRPIFREHKGKYTTLCMFWTASDVFKLRLEQKRVEEAEKIYEALKRLFPRIEEIEASDDQAASKREESPAKEQAHHKGQASGFMKFAEGRLIKESERFRKRYFAMRDKKREASPAPTTSPAATVSAASPSAPVPVGSPAASPASSVLSGSPSSFTSLHISGESAPVEGLNAGQQAVLDCIKAHEGINVPRISDLTNIPSKSIERHVSALIARNLIEHHGSKKTGGYYVK